MSASPFLAPCPFPVSSPFALLCSSFTSGDTSSSMSISPKSWLKVVIFRFELQHFSCCKSYETISWGEWRGYHVLLLHPKGTLSLASRDSLLIDQILTFWITTSQMKQNSMPFLKKRRGFLSSSQMNQSHLMRLVSIWKIPIRIFPAYLKTCLAQTVQWMCSDGVLRMVQPGKVFCTDSLVSQS